jgi:hypothetical protein
MRGRVAIFEGIPDFAALHPGYACYACFVDDEEVEGVGASLARRLAGNGGIRFIIRPEGLSGGAAVADNKLPVVLKAGLRVGLICFFWSAVSAVAAYAKLSEQYASSVSFYRVVEIDGRTAGWLFTAFAALLACYGLLAVVRGCPRLALNATGISFSRCFGSPVQIPWSRYEDVEVEREVVPGPRRSAVVDIVYVMTTDGQRTSVGNCWKASDLEDAIRRTAARMKGGASGT